MVKKVHLERGQKQAKIEEVENYKKTGMSTEKACKMAGVKSGTFYNWVHEVKRGAQPHRAKEPNKQLVVNEQTTHLEIPVTLVIPITLGTIILKMSETETS